VNKTKLLLISRPDHSINLYKELRKHQDLTFITFNVPLPGSILKKMLKKGKVIPGNYINCLFFSIYNQLSRRFKMLGFNRFEDSVASFEAQFHIRNNNFDIIHYWPIYFTELVRKLKNNNCKSKYIADVYEANYKTVKEIYKEAYKKNGFVYVDIKGKDNRFENLDVADVIFVPSSFVKKTYENHVKSRIEVIDYGLLGHNVEKTKNTFNGKKLNCLFIGNASIEKGFDLLLKLDFDELNIDISSAGGVSEEVKSLALTGDVKNINWLGNLPFKELQSLISEYDAIILPSYSDAFSMGIIEGILKQKPVIVSDNCGNADIVERWKIGTTFSSGDIKSLSTAIIELKENYRYFRKNILIYDEFEQKNSYPKRVLEIYKKLKEEDN